MLYSMISVLIPTRKRVARLCTLLESYDKTNEGLSELVFRVDDDDTETLGFLARRPMLKTIVGPRLDGYDSMPVFFNELYAASNGDVLMCGNDDMIFRTPGWAGRLLEVANRFPDGLFDLGVSTHNETHYPFSVVSRKAADHLGFLWNPHIFWGDIYLRDMMAAFGRCVMVPDVVIDHDWAGNNPDQVFLDGHRDIVSKNPTYWTSVHAGAVDAAVSRLRGLL